jgi:hypothetical protein
MGREGYVTGGTQVSATWRAFGREVEVEVEVENIEVEMPLTLTISPLYVICILQDPSAISCLRTFVTTWELHASIFGTRVESLMIAFPDATRGYPTTTRRSAWRFC